MRTSAKFWEIRNLSVSVALLVLSGAVGIAASSPGALAPAGLQAEYNFAEGSGATTAGDSSGSGFHATLQNGAAFAAGRVGFGVSLDGLNDFINLGDSRSFIQNSSGGTVSIWVKPGSVIPSGSFREVVSISVGSANLTKTSRLALALKGDGSTGGQVFFGARSTDTESQKGVTTTQGVAVGTWTHLVGVVDYQNNTLRVWINGVVAATATAVGFSSGVTANTPARNSALGSQDDGVGNHFAGGLDQVRIYNRALSDAEIQALASADELRAHWTLDDGAGLVAFDASGNLHVGNLKNGLETGWVGGGQVGGALGFDGVDDFVQVDAPGLLRNVNGGTVALWVKPSSVIPSGAFRELVSISVGGTASDVSRVALALRGDGTSAGDAFLGGRASDSETQRNSSFDASLPVGVWTHLCGVVNYLQGTLEIYVNGLLATSAPVAFVQPSSANTSSPSISLGAQDTGSSNRYAGTMDAVRVYGRALTACEVQELAGRDGLQAYWKFDETSGATAADSSLTGLAATLKNGASFLPGLRGNALNLDGVDDYADLGLALPILRGANAATVAAWINLGSVPPSGAFREVVSVAVGGSPSNTSRLALAVKGTAAGTADIFVGGRSADTEAQQSLTAPAGIQPGVWRHIAATLDVGHNAIRIFLDGIQIASANVAFSQPTMATTSPANGALGAQDLGNANWINSKLDELRIYCRVLSAAEIASLAASVAPAAPVLSLVEEGNQQVKLSWTSVPGADFYNVKRSTTQGSGYVTIASPGGTTYPDLGLTNGVTYFYVVTAQNAAGPSPDSNEIAAMPTGGVPPAPVITSPASGTILNSASPPVSGTSSSSGLTITLLVDGSANGTTVAGVAGNWSLTPAAALTEGPHSLTATATDSSGTSPSSLPVNIIIDTKAPLFSNLTPPSGSGTTNTTPQISGSWVDTTSGLIISSAVINLDDVPVTASVTATGFSFTPGALSLGLHAVSVQISDAAGNVGEIVWGFYVRSPTLPAPTGLTSVGLNSRVSLTWNAVAGASSYRVWRSTQSGGGYEYVGNPATTSFVDLGLTNGRTYFYVVSALNAGSEGLNSTEASATPNPPASINVLLVVGSSTLTSGDAAIKGRLEGIGYSVVVKSAAQAVATDADGKAVVVISSTASPGDLTLVFRTVAIPVLNCQSGLSGDLGMTGTTSGVDFGTASGQTAVTIQDPIHELAASLSGTVTVVTSPTTLMWGIPNTNAVKIATLASDVSKYTIFGYQTGLTMPGLVAPARRVGLFLSDSAAVALSPDGGTLFDASVRWAAGTPTTPSAVSTQVSDGQITVTWNATEGALSYNLLMATSLGGPFTLIASGLSVTQFTLGGLTNGTPLFFSVVAFNDGGGSGASMVASGTPRAKTLKVGVLGPRHMRAQPPVPPTDSFNYSEGAYKAFVALTEPGKPPVDVRPGFLKPPPPVVWTAIPAAQGLVILAAGSTQKDATWTVAGPATGALDLEVSATHTVETDDTGAFLTAKKSWTIVVSKKRFVNVELRFPEDAPGKTKRIIKNADGVVKDLFSLDADERTAARGLLADEIKKGLQKHWRQVDIDFKIHTENNLGLTIGGGFVGGNFKAGTGAGPTTEMTNLRLKNNPATSINLYFVEGVLDGAKAIGGYTLNPLVDGSDRLTVVISDKGEGDDSIVAHEIGHAFGLDEAEKLPALTGALNNLSEVMDLAAAKRSLLMLSAARNLNDGVWLLEDQAVIARDKSFNIGTTE